jgi:hypothetical protein
MYLLGEFNVWKRFSGAPVYAMPARVVDAIVILDKELREEAISLSQEKNGQRIGR